MNDAEADQILLPADSLMLSPTDLPRAVALEIFDSVRYSKRAISIELLNGADDFQRVSKICSPGVLRTMIRTTCEVYLGGYIEDASDQIILMRLMRPSVLPRCSVYLVVINSSQGCAAFWECNIFGRPRLLIPWLFEEGKPEGQILLVSGEDNSVLVWLTNHELARLRSGRLRKFAKWVARGCICGELDSRSLNVVSQHLESVLTIVRL